MNIYELKKSYKDQLLKAGVDSEKAGEAAENLSFEELLLIREIWQDWSILFSEIEQIINLRDK